MKLEQLKQKGAMVAQELVPCEVTWKHVDAENGEEVEDTFNIFIVRQSFGVMSDIIKADSPNYRRGAGISAACVRLGESGEEVMTYEDAYSLESSLAFLFLEKVSEVNKSKGKNSKQKTNSGTN